MTTTINTENLLDQTVLDALIAEAPDGPTQEQLAAEAQQELQRRHMLALGPLTGWPAKYLEAAREDPHGEQWLAACELAKGRVLANGIVVLFGPRGTGKTRLAAELAVMVGKSRYRTAMRFFLEVRATYKRDSQKSELDVIDELTSADLLVIDEIQERGDTPFEDRLLTHVIDARYSAMKPTVLIANLKKAELAESLGLSIVDRCREIGRSIECNWPSYRTPQP